MPSLRNEKIASIGKGDISLDFLNEEEKESVME